MVFATYEEQRESYLSFLQGRKNSQKSGRDEDIRTTPLFSLAVKHEVDPISSLSRQVSGTDEIALTDGKTKQLLPQYALLGFNIADDSATNHAQDELGTYRDEAHNRGKTTEPTSSSENPTSSQDENCLIGFQEPILMNTRAPNSAFICGSQGSGKSYTLSCMLENCLLPDDTIGALSNPVAGLVFHYDVDAAGSAAEAASLCSRGINVRVLVSESNKTLLTEKYTRLAESGDRLKVQELRLRSGHLTVERILKLMSCSEQEVKVPLYIVSLQRILREMAKETQSGEFDYLDFRQRIVDAGFTKDQQNPLDLRCDLLESFLNLNPGSEPDPFELQPGTLTIIDLSDPFVDSATACLLFDICLSLSKQKCLKSGTGLIVALDEAHKFMNDSPAAMTFTNRLLTTIREQRHNATRVVIATQEPTISEKLLDLCSISIVHRFSSPTWFTTIKGHLGGASVLLEDKQQQAAMFEQIVNLQVGESLVFAPSSYLCMKHGKAEKLGSGMMKMKTRLRLGVDSGRSLLTDQQEGQDARTGSVAGAATALDGLSLNQA